MVIFFLNNTKLSWKLSTHFRIDIKYHNVGIFGMERPLECKLYLTKHFKPISMIRWLNNNNNYVYVSKLNNDWLLQTCRVQIFPIMILINRRGNYAYRNLGFINLLAIDLNHKNSCNLFFLLIFQETRKGIPTDWFNRSYASVKENG